MEKELVSIIMPSYNNRLYIADAVRSVMQQTYSNWELLITDDASIDDSVQIINSFVSQDKRIRLFKLEKNSGVSAARNYSIQQAKGRYIAFLDSDDCWHSEKLEKQLAFMQHYQYAFTFTSYQLMSSKGVLLNKMIIAPKEMSYKQYLKNTIIGCLTVIIDREKIRDIKVPALQTSQDMALWLDILRTGIHAYGLDEVLAYYRLSSNSNSANKIKAAKQVWTLYRNYEKLSCIVSLYNFLGYTYHAVKKRL